MIRQTLPSAIHSVAKVTGDVEGGFGGSRAGLGVWESGLVYGKGGQ